MNGTLVYVHRRCGLGAQSNKIDGLSNTQAESIVETLRLSPETIEVIAYFFPEVVTL